MSGALNPDCDAGKAAKSAAMKATVGVGSNGVHQRKRPKIPSGLKIKAR